MTVQELIAQLQQLPGDMLVMQEPFIVQAPLDIRGWHNGSEMSMEPALWFEDVALMPHEERVPLAEWQVSR